MNAARLLRNTVLVLLGGGTLFAPSCGDIVISSIKSGLFTFVSGSVTNTVGSGQLNDVLTSFLTGGSTTTTTGS